MMCDGKDHMEFFQVSLYRAGMSPIENADAIWLQETGAKIVIYKSN